MSETTIDHDAIRKWADSHGAKPAAVESTHSEDDVGLIRIMHPDAPNSHHGNLVEITWDEFFEEFEAKGLAMILVPNSNFSKIIKREGAK